MDSTARIMWGLLFGSFGMGYLVYGKKQRQGIALLSGFGLCFFPYFVSSTILLVLIGLALLALPFILRY